jgi:hypothetical protein
MKKLSALISVLFIGSAISLAACKKDNKDDDKKDTGKKADEGKKDEGKKDEGKKDEGGGGFKTGIAECDELFERSMKCFDKMGDAGKEARAAFQESAKAYQDMAANEATKQAAADACKQSVEAAKAGWEAAGC